MILLTMLLKKLDTGGYKITAITDGPYLQLMHVSPANTNDLTMCILVLLIPIFGFKFKLAILLNYTTIM